MNDDQLRRKLEAERKRVRENIKLEPWMLWTPRKPTQDESEPETMRNYHSYSVWGQAFPYDPIPTFSEIEHSLKEFNGPDLLQWLSKLNFLSQSRAGGRFLSVKLFKGFFDESALNNLIRMEENYEQWIFLPPCTITFLQKMTIANCPSIGGKMTNTDEPLVGKLLLASNSYSEGFRYKEGSKRQLFATIVRNFYFNSAHRLITAAGRYWEMAGEIRSSEIPENINGKLVPPYRTHIAATFAIHTRYSTENVNTYFQDPERFLLDDAYFRTLHPSFQPIIKKTLRSLSRTWEQHKAEIGAMNQESGGYNAKCFYDFPLIELSTGAFFCIDTAKLTYHLGEGYYFRIIDQLKKNKSAYAEFKRSWGESFERYAQKVLEAASTGTSARIFPRLEEDGPDFYVVDGTSLFAIEACTTRISVFRLLTGVWKEVAKTINLLLFRTESGAPGKAYQLSKGIADVISGKTKLPGIDPSSIKDVYPILLLERGVPHIPGIIDHFRKRIGRLTKCRGYENFEFWDIDELEHSRGAFKHGIAAVFADKHREGLGGECFKNYLLRKEYYEDLPVLTAGFDAAIDEMKVWFFGGSAP